MKTLKHSTHSFRRLIVGFLMTLVAGVGLTLTASPAEAATVVRYCFVHANGAPLDREITSLHAYHNGRWYLVAYGRTGSSGCENLNVSPWAAYPVRVTAGTPLGRLTGATPLIAPAGYGYAYLGIGVARLSWY